MVLRTKIVKASAEDDSILQIKRDLLENHIKGKYAYYRMEEDGLIRYKGLVYISLYFDLRKKVLDELH